ncbi:MAG: M48 family metallopeptidase [Chloroflexi bacterium]|nr:M48 family metallopeptidase [Chloroflexota bacterium]
MSVGPAPAFGIRRSARARRLRLRILPSGEVVVTLPTRAPERLAAELVREKSAWIARHQLRLGAVRARLDERPGLDRGRVLSVRGRPLEVGLVPTAGERTHVVEDPIAGRLSVHLDPGDERSASSVIEVWLRAEARREITRLIERHAPAIGVTPTRSVVRDQSSRWGSASRRGTVSFSWRLVLAPPEVLEYVVVHELAHLRDLSHSDRFWRLVGTHSPHVAASRRWLREHEAELRYALD